MKTFVRDIADRLMTRLAAILRPELDAHPAATPHNQGVLVWPR